MSKNKNSKNIFEQAVSEMKHFLVGAVFVLVLVGIVPAFAQMSYMNMGSMSGGMGMMPSSSYTMPSYTMPSQSPMPMSGMGMTSTEKMPCSYLGGQLATPAECGAAWDAAMKASTPVSTPAQTPASNPTLSPSSPVETPKEAAPEEDFEDLEAIETLESELELKAEQAVLAQKLAALAEQINSEIITPLTKSLGRVKGKNTKKLMKSAAKAIEKSITQGREESCVEYPTEVFKLKCELLFTNALQAVKQASFKKNPTPADFNKILKELGNGLKDLSVD